MKSIKLKEVLDPTWMVKSKNIDLEYYTFILLAANKEFDKIIPKSYSNLQEAVYHYLNLNHLEISGKVYDLYMKEIEDHNAPKLFDGFKSGNEEILDIFVEAEEKLSSLLLNYLDRALGDYSKLEFHFNSLKIHKREKIYIVLKYLGDTKYEIWKLRESKKQKLGFKYDHVITADFKEDPSSSFKEKVIALDPTLNDFEPKQNVLVVICNTKSLRKKECLYLAKDMVIMNKSININMPFDSNAPLEFKKEIERHHRPEITAQPRI